MKGKPELNSEHPLKFYWADNCKNISQLVDFFIKNVKPSYISHGEVQDGRALDMNTWSPRLHAVLETEFGKAFESFDKQKKYSQIAVAEDHKGLSAMALVEFRSENHVAILQDVVVDQSRREMKIGARFLHWIEEEAKVKGIRFLFLESGKNNTRAHQFFENHGYSISSIEMVKKI